MKNKLKKEETNINKLEISIKFKEIFKIMIGLSLFVFILFIGYSTYSFLLTILISFSIVLFISPFLDILNKLKIKDAYGFLIIYFFFLIFLTLVLIIVIPLLIKQSIIIGELINVKINSIATIYNTKGLTGFGLSEQSINYVKPLFDNFNIENFVRTHIDNFVNMGKIIGPKLLSFFNSGLTFIGSFVNFLIFSVTIFITTFFAVLERKAIGKIVSENSPGESKKYLEKLYPQFSQIILSWIKSQVLLALSIFSISFIFLFVISLFSSLTLYDALSLALIAGLMEFIPYVGPILAIIPALAVGIGLGTKFFIIILIGYIIIQQIENNVLVPFIMNKTLNISPLLLLLMMFFLGSFLGFIGIIIAIPISGLVYIIYKDYRKNKKEN